MSKSASVDSEQVLEALIAQVRPAIRAQHAYAVPKVAGIEVKLDANESPHELSAELRDQLSQRLSTLSYNRYPDPQAAELRALLAAEYGVAQDQLILGNGSDEIIQVLLTTFAEPQKAKACVLYPSPTFSVFGLFAQSHGIDTVSVPLDDNFELDVEATRAAIAEHAPNIAFFARPNNPTGTLWPGDALLALCREFPATLIVSDEAYGEYSPGSLVGELQNYPNLLVMRTLSKIGLAALRVGMAIAHPRLIAELEKSRAPYNISSLNQTAASFLLKEAREYLRARCAEVVRERQRVDSHLRSLPLRQPGDLRVYDSEANLILFRVGAAGAGAGPRVWSSLCEAGVLVRCFGSEGPLADCLRVSIGTADENSRFLAALEGALAGEALLL